MTYTGFTKKHIMFDWKANYITNRSIKETVSIWVFEEDDNKGMVARWLLRGFSLSYNRNIVTSSVMTTELTTGCRS